MKVAKPIYNITPFTLLDYPDKTACIFWFAGCNMRCVYCYNPNIVLEKGKLTIDQAINFIEKRKGLLDAVVLSGGECTGYKGIINLAEKIKKHNMLVKIDTNGSRPDVIEKLINKNCIDYVALDLKGLDDTFLKITKSKLNKKFDETLKILINSKIPFEIRTTFHSDLLSVNEIEEMAEYIYQIGYRGTYYLQNYLANTPTLGKIKNESLKLKREDLKVENMNIVIRN
ncbi:MAG: anaerobic ribonucleoside-triphosphate reductase activating protein [Bacteroidia bacterium]|nr:anaerobic ribonucleoside-triphosphate reductase activating protein [Bacteroidia bacterium]